MNLKFSVVAQNPLEKQAWVAQMKAAFDDQVLSSSPDEAQILFFDIHLKDLETQLGKADRRKQALFLLLQDGSESSEDLPELLKEGKVDGVILFPFRKLELLNCVRVYEQILQWQQVGEFNHSLSKTIENLSEDLLLAERLQKRSLPQRFSEIKNFQVNSRYLAGTASGGDYFDLAEFPSSPQSSSTPEALKNSKTREKIEKKSLSIILSNSSSYGLSSSVLAILMKVTLKLSQEQEGEALSPSLVLKRIYDELLLVLGDKDQLSLFYGTITHSDLRMRYVNLGNASAYLTHVSQDGLTQLPKQGGPIRKGVLISEVTENEIQLTPGERLALISGGFDEACGGSAGIQQVLQSFRHKQSVDTLNELVFQAKAGIDPEIGMPSRDCSAVIFDVESRALRSIKPRPDES